MRTSPNASPPAATTSPGNFRRPGGGSGRELVPAGKLPQVPRRCRACDEPPVPGFGGACETCLAYQATYQLAEHQLARLNPGRVTG
jgi:hypothetical protein